MSNHWGTILNGICLDSFLLFIYFFWERICLGSCESYIYHIWITYLIFITYSIIFFLFVWEKRRVVLFWISLSKSTNMVWKGRQYWPAGPSLLTVLLMINSYGPADQYWSSAGPSLWVGESTKKLHSGRDRWEKNYYTWK